MFRNRLVASILHPRRTLISVKDPATQSRAVAGFFRDAFESEPPIIASAPGRVNLIGEHTDYNGGEVLPIAISSRTWVAIGAAPGGSPNRAVSANASGAGEWHSAAAQPSGGWWDYIHGVANELAEGGIALPPLRVAVLSDVPSGAGLSSSAALGVATAAALADLAEAPLTPLECAEVAHRAETQFVGVTCGIMDQFASALGRSGEALHLWCDTAQYEYVMMSQSVLIFDTGVPRTLRGSAFNTRREECDAALAMLRMSDPDLPNLASASPDLVDSASLPTLLRRRARHVVEETRRVGAVVRALQASGTIPGELLYESHESLRSLFECSSAELDWFVERAAQAPGISGARLTGAGWGGCAIAVGEPDALEEAAAAIAADYERRFGVTPRTWITHASGGLSIERCAS